MRRGLLVVFVGVAALVAPPSASAQLSVSESGGEIRVRGRDAAVSVQRSPFRVAFLDRSDRAVLRQTHRRVTAARPIGPQVDPQPIGLDLLPGTPHYAPLTFLVGSEALALHPGGIWGGNRLIGARSGVVHAAREVTAVERLPGRRGVALTLSTTDPGRTMRVEITSPRAGAMRLSAQVTPGDDVAAIADSFTAGRDEAFRGFGGRSNSLDQRGNEVVHWTEGQTVGPGPFEPVTSALPGTPRDETYKFPTGPTAAYDDQAIFWSSRDYAFLLDSDQLGRFRLAKDHADAWQAAARGSRLAYVVAPGPRTKPLRTMTALTGRHRMPEPWMVGPMLDRLATPFTETGATYERKVRDDLAKIDAFELPVTAYRIEGFGSLKREVLRDLIGEFHRRGIRALLYLRAFASVDGAGTDPPEIYDQAVKGGYVAKNAQGNSYVYPGNFFSSSVLFDFTNPATHEWWYGRVAEMLDLGADGFMQDFGEQTQPDMRFADGSTGAEMHNRFPVVFHRATRIAINRWRARERERTGRRARQIWFFTRAGSSGTPGSAAYENANFPGDNETDWSRSFGIKSVITDMLNRGLTGQFGFGTDIGGYFDYHTGKTTKELFIRWAQLAALSPVMRLHGSANSGTHVPWIYDAETVRLYRELSRLHVRATPYLRRLWRIGLRTGVPPVRPLYLNYPDDRRAAEQDQEFMLGPDVLVAPVVNEGARSRIVYFPAGCWRLHGRGEALRAPAERRVDAPLDTLPWFTRCGKRPF